MHRSHIFLGKRGRDERAASLTMQDALGRGHVVVGVLQKCRSVGVAHSSRGGRVASQPQRLHVVPCAKLQRSETLLVALRRELGEEHGVRIDASQTFVHRARPILRRRCVRDLVLGRCTVAGFVMCSAWTSLAALGAVSRAPGMASTLVAAARLRESAGGAPAPPNPPELAWKLCAAVRGTR